MKQYLLHRILDYVLGCPGDDEMRRMVQILAQSPVLTQEAVLMQEALAMRAIMLQRVAPPPGGRERLLATLESVERFRSFLGPLCQVVDLPEAVMRRLLARVDDSEGWEVGPVPGLYLTHFQPGPRASSGDAGFVRVSAGQIIPRHRHLGPEVALVLEGTLWEDGIAYPPGHLVERGAGSVHGFQAGCERDLVFAVTHSGVEIV
jgi:quercetin dioxygenase-like cupin family protein